jgi:general stress protein YciG
MVMTGNNSNRGFASMSDDKQRDIASKGGKASAKSSKGAAGSTDAAKRGGENSHKNQ